MQLITPNPAIPCTPGYCLQYVRETFGIEPGVYPTATSGWENAKYKHEDYDFPENSWIPLWFSMKEVPAGHVVLLNTATGEVWSTTNANQYTPRIHPNLDDLLRVYKGAGLKLTYLGWSEDIETVRIWEEIVKLDDETIKKLAQATAHEILNKPAFDATKDIPKPPTVSVWLREQWALMFNPNNTNESIPGKRTFPRMVNEGLLNIQNNILEAIKAK